MVVKQNLQVFFISNLSSNENPDVPDNVRTFQQNPRDCLVMNSVRCSPIQLL